MSYQCYLADKLFHTMKHRTIYAELESRNIRSAPKLKTEVLNSNFIGNLHVDLVAYPNLNDRGWTIPAF